MTIKMKVANKLKKYIPLVFIIAFPRFNLIYNFDSVLKYFEHLFGF